MKIKIKFYGDEVTDFYDKKISKVDSDHTCLPVISLDSALNKDGNNYSQVFLKDIEKKVIRHIIDDLGRKFWWKQFWKMNFLGSNFENVFYKGAILKMLLLRG